MKKTAVILMNLGGPDSLESVKPFLFNLFYDKAIIRLPNPLRWIVAKAISFFRAGYSQSIYAQMGGKSPILAETLRQKEALDKLLGNNRHLSKLDYPEEVLGSEARKERSVQMVHELLSTGADDKITSRIKFRKMSNIRTFIYMRYWHPMAPEVADAIKEYAPDEVVLLPLYPHFSTTTTESSIDEIEKYLKGYNIKKICCYYDFEPFIDAHVQNIKKEFDKIQDFSNVILLFSAHSIPEKFVKDGDPYQFQTEASVLAIMKKLGIDIEYKITYQSKVGRMKWLSPSTDQEIISAAKAGKQIYIVPISFVSEHSETLVELDIDYKKLAEENGAKKYFRFPTLSNSEKYIEALAKILLQDSNARIPDCALRCVTGVKNARCGRQ